MRSHLQQYNLRCVIVYLLYRTNWPVSESERRPENTCWEHQSTGLWPAGRLSFEEDSWSSSRGGTRSPSGFWTWWKSPSESPDGETSQNTHLGGYERGEKFCITDTDITKKYNRSSFKTALWTLLSRPMIKTCDRQRAACVASVNRIKGGLFIKRISEALGASALMDRAGGESGRLTIMSCLVLKVLMYCA